MPSAHTLLQNAVILDTETTGLARGSGIHELAVYDFETQAVHEYFLRPNYVETYTNPLQEHTRLASSPLDRHIGQYPERWMDVIRAQLVMDKQVEKTATNKQVLRALETSNPFLARALEQGKHPHLLGKPQDPRELKARERALKASGQVRQLVSHEAAIQDVLAEGGALERAIRGGEHRQGRTVWIANAAFEAKQVGAQLGAMGAEHADRIKSLLETSSGSPDPFYVTGSEVNLARVQAQLTGDWSGVYRAYKQFVPRAGETAVRDIQDVLRSMMSMGRNLGLVEFDDPYLGTSMDTSSRLFGSLEPDRQQALQRLLTPEVHRAAEDVAKTESYVLRKALHYTGVLQQVADDTELGRQYLDQARKRSGPLYEIAAYFERLSSLRQTSQEANLVKRLARAEHDFMEMGKTWQRTGISGISTMRQKTPLGAERQVPRVEYSRRAFTSREDLVKYLAEEGRYQGIDIAGRMSEMQEYLGDTSKQARAQKLSEYLQEKAANVVDEKIRAEADMLVDLQNRNLGKVVSRHGLAGRAASDVVDAMSQMKAPSLIKGWGALAGGLTALGVGWSLIAGNSKPTRDAPSLVTYNYKEWLQHQEGFYGQRSQYEQTQGMHDSGILGSMRRIATDFGSPYQGIMGSQVVFHEQELLNQREKWLREQYGARHFDPEIGLHGLYGPFKQAMRKGYNYIAGGRPAGNYAGLQGDLLELDLTKGNWRIKVEDADTIVLQQGGVRGGLASFFGMNRKYSFRLAGLDAPETSHGETSYHAPMPGGEASKAALAKLVEGSNNLKLVFDPEQTTYGRMMGAVIADGKNLNFEMVKRGMVAHLPYGKSEESMIDYGSLKSAETRAHKAGRGIWALPYYQSFYDVTGAMGRRPTFNTLTRTDRIVENAWQMDMLSLMEQSQAHGFYGTAAATEATRIGGAVRGHRGPDQVAPVLFNQPHSHYNTYLAQMQRDLGNWNKTHGTGRNQNKFSRKGGYGKLDHGMVLDTLGTTDNVWNKKRLQAFESYNSGRQLARTRKQRMAAAQRQVNNEFFNSPINHHVM